MNTFETSNKITSEHIKRNAYLYIRQSTIRQVIENTESTKRQYDLKQRAIAMGWPADQIVVIDNDLGRSGAETDRAGFQRLVSEVGMGKAGIVMGLEVSRLARNSTDWHKLLEICAFNTTLIMDEEGIYDPMNFNDRLLLGLKGTMSEAELHIIRARLQGGINNKAKRGELRMRLPIGFLYDINEQVILDPDQQIQNAIKTLFEVFLRTGAGRATVKYFREQGLKFPRRPNTGLSKGEVLWDQLGHTKVLEILHNPRYSGTFVFGKTRTRKNFEGKSITRNVVEEEWQVVIRDAHIGYISWDSYLLNKKILRENAQACGLERRKSPPREGAALLQGIVICGVCGKRMTVRYNHVNKQIVPIYVCQKEGIENGIRICQSISGLCVDKLIEKRLEEMINPMNLEISLAVEKEIQKRMNEANELKKQEVERTRYQAELARRRYMRVDPDNRLVASTLEADWNAKIREYQVCFEEYEQKYQAEIQFFNEQKQAEIMELSNSFPKIWNNPKVPQRERKRLVRLLIEDVTLVKDQEVNIHIRFKGGTNCTINLPKPKNSWQLKQTSFE
jgi:DNA invertase Pin-like site-specific DNA recombinase